MTRCSRCDGELERSFRFCPWCAEPQRRKIVEFFLPHPGIESPARALRVSRYLGVADGDRHVRFSIWDDEGRAEAALSLGDDEAERLGGFLLATSHSGRSRPRASTLDRLRAAVRL